MFLSRSRARKPTVRKGVSLMGGFGLWARGVARCDMLRWVLNPFQGMGTSEDHTVSVSERAVGPSLEAELLETTVEEEPPPPPEFYRYMENSDRGYLELAELDQEKSSMILGVLIQYASAVLGAVAAIVNRVSEEQSSNKAAIDELFLVATEQVNEIGSVSRRSNMLTKMGLLSAHGLVSNIHMGVKQWLEAVQELAKGVIQLQEDGEELKDEFNRVLPPGYKV